MSFILSDRAASKGRTRFGVKSEAYYLARVYEEVYGLDLNGRDFTCLMAERFANKRPNEALNQNLNATASLRLGERNKPFDKAAFERDVRALYKSEYEYLSGVADGSVDPVVWDYEMGNSESGAIRVVRANRIELSEKEIAEKRVQAAKQLADMDPPEDFEYLYEAPTKA